MPRRRMLLGSGCVLAVLLAACATLMAYQGLTAKRELVGLQSDMSRAKTLILSGNVTAARTTATSARNHGERAAALTDGPLWKVASHLPLVGKDIRVVRDLAAAGDSLSTGVLAPLADAAPTLKSGTLQARNGGIDLSPLRSASVPLKKAATTLDAVNRSLQDSPDARIGQVKSAKSEVLQQVDQAESVLAPLATASSIAAPMLGETTPRTYLLLFQTNAEVRATGGMPGAFLIVRAEKGKLTLLKQGAPATLGTFTEPTSPLPADLEGMYDINPGVYFQDVNFTPNWPWAAGRAREMVAAKTGITVDGVAALDPVVLSYVMGQQGITTARGTTVRGADVASYLLNQIYFDKRGDPAGQNAFFATTAQSAFSKLAAGGIGSVQALSGLSKGADEGRVLLWSAHKNEQAVLGSTALAGPLRPVTAGAGTSTPTTLGVFLNGAIPSKMDYYLKQDVSIDPTPVCQLDELVKYRATIRLTSALTAAQAAGLPADIQGPATYIKKGQNQVQVVGYLDNGGLFGAMSTDGKPTRFGSGTDAGRTTFVTSAVLDPNRTGTITVDFYAKEGADVILRTTPLSSQSNTRVSDPVHSFGATATRTLEECNG